MSHPNTIEQNGQSLGQISHLRIQRGAHKTEVIFELETRAAKAVDISKPCTLIDDSGSAHVVSLVKIFFSQWAFRAKGEVVRTEAAGDEKSD